jgi:hypothetical protein
VAGSCNYGNELSSLKVGEFLDQLSDCHLFKEVSVYVVSYHYNTTSLSHFTVPGTIITCGQYMNNSI